MGLFSSIKWKLSSDRKKLGILREQGLRIGGGVKFSMVMTLVPSLISSLLETTCASRAALKLPPTTADAGCFAISIPNMRIAIVSVVLLLAITATLV